MPLRLIIVRVLPVHGREPQLRVRRGREHGQYWESADGGEWVGGGVPDPASNLRPFR